MWATSEVTDLENRLDSVCQCLLNVDRQTQKALSDSLEQFIYQAIQNWSPQMSFKIPSQSAHHGTYSPAYRACIDNRSPRILPLWVVWYSLHALVAAFNSSRCIHTSAIDKGRMLCMIWQHNEGYTTCFETIHLSEQPRNTGSGVSSILSKTYTSPFRNLHSHNVFDRFHPRTLRIPPYVHQFATKKLPARIKHRK